MDLSQIYNPDPPDNDASNRSEWDLHADTCVAGANTIPLWTTLLTVAW